MKHSLTILLIFLGTALRSAAAGEGKVIVLAPAANVEAAQVEALRDYLEANADLAIRAADPRPVENPVDLEALGRAAEADLRPDEYAVIVVVRAGKDQPLRVAPASGHFAVLNLDPLEEPPGHGVDRRAGQMALRLLAHRLGLSPCPFPLCVLVSQNVPAELDNMSGNYCPPCRDRLHRFARAAGVKMVGFPAEDIPSTPPPIPDPSAPPPAHD